MGPRSETGAEAAARALHPHRSSPRGPRNAHAIPGADIELAGERLRALASGALAWPDRQLLAVGDLHLGKSERIARRGGAILPPYETLDTLNRLEADILALAPRLVICLGDSFDDLEAVAELSEEVRARLERLAAGRRWIWVAGNHDPGPVELPGSHLAEVGLGPITFRHIADRHPSDNGRLGPDAGEVSAHYHPRATLARRGQRLRRACFLGDRHRVILPAYGTYTGGLDVQNPAFDPLFPGGAVAYLVGQSGVFPVDRSALG